MARYSASVRTPAAAAGAAYADLRTAATDRAFVTEIGIFTSAATATSLGLIRPLTVGTASTTTLGQAEDPGNPAGTATIGSAWSVAPTIAASPIYLRRIALPATQAAGVIWTWPAPGLVVSVSSSLILWNFGAAAGAACDVYIAWDE
jgi:hypothetical protein